jgi:hypothetical protein
MNQPATNLASQDNTISALDDQTELLWWHCRLGHLSFANLRLMAAKQHKVATVFVDHFSCLLFVCLQESPNGAKTLLAKKAFEAHAPSLGVKVPNHHAGNGRVAERFFLDHAAENGQTVTLCGVSAHFQNGIAEK